MKPLFVFVETAEKNRNAANVEGMVSVETHDDGS
jgi:hypothetical protein